MANCAKCGSSIEQGDTFCGSCGARMTDAPAATRSEGAVPAPPPSSSFTRSRPAETQRDPIAPRRLLNPSALAWFQRRAKRERIVLAAIPILLVIIVIAVASSATSSHGVDLTGRWVTRQYTCPSDVFHRETVKVTQTGTHLVAKKLVGDDCVRGGETTFMGTNHGKGGLVDFWTAALGGTPSIGQQNDTVQIQNENRFTASFAGVGTMVFTRIGNSHGGVSWWWLLIVILVLLVAVIVYLLMRRRQSEDVAW